MDNGTEGAADAPNTTTTMDRETERAVEDIKATLLRMEGKIDALVPQVARTDERIKALEAQLHWIWGALGMSIAAIAAQMFHFHLG